MPACESQMRRLLEQGIVSRIEEGDFQTESEEGVAQEKYMTKKISKCNLS